jgi:leader peptidase (prepilin peptidase) / N-methyltransferase
MTFLWPVFAGILGLAVGSFLNVCIYRLPLRQSLVFPASHCTSCNRKLSWYENVPVLAWVVLRGRCRTCHEAISAVYPFVELFTGAMFAWATWQYGPGWLLASRLLFGCMLVVLFFIDLRHRILPNVITVGGTLVGFILSFVTEPGWVSSLVGLVIGALIPWAIAEFYFKLRKLEGLGMGDVKMLAMIGAFLGWKLVLFTLVVASFLGSFLGLGMIALGRGNLKSSMAFGTFLAIAAMLAAAVGDPIVRWYVGYYR